MRILFRFWCLAGIALAAMLLAASPAPAFYWSLKVIPSVINPGDQNTPGNPPIPGSNPIPLPPDIPVPNVPGGPPGSVPEPSTAAAGVIGLGLILSACRRRRR
jgi:MYXO-CTERM domain-containing protein